MAKCTASGRGVGQKIGVTVDNYTTDKYYPKVVAAFDSLLSEGNVVAPIDVFIKIGNLDKRKVEDWRFGRVPYLESVIDGNLSRCSRILRIIGFHAHDLNMRPNPTVYKKWGKGKAIHLRFTKGRVQKIELAYSKCFVCNRSMAYLEWKQSENIDSEELYAHSGKENLENC